MSRTGSEIWQNNCPERPRLKRAIAPIYIHILMGLCKRSVCVSCLPDDLDQLKRQIRLQIYLRTNTVQALK